MTSNWKVREDNNGICVIMIDRSIIYLVEMMKHERDMIEGCLRKKKKE
jgi:hypothetical protein